MAQYPGLTFGDEELPIGWHPRHAPMITNPHHVAAIGAASDAVDRYGIDAGLTAEGVPARGVVMTFARVLAPR